MVELEVGVGNFNLLLESNPLLRFGRSESCGMGRPNKFF